MKQALTAQTVYITHDTSCSKFGCRAPIKAGTYAVAKYIQGYKTLYHRDCAK